MSLRKLFCILILVAIFFTVIIVGLWQYQKYEVLPHHPCSSTIDNGNFFDETFQPYTFNGVITWWPSNHRLTLFGVRDDGDIKRVFERTLIIDPVNVVENNIHGKVKEVRVSVADQLPKGMTLIGEEGKGMALIFKRINTNRWLMLINDNWVMMCENK